MLNFTGKSNTPEPDSPAANRTVARHVRNGLLTLGAATAMTAMSLGTAGAAPVSHPDGPTFAGPAAQVLQVKQDKQAGNSKHKPAAKDQGAKKERGAKKNAPQRNAPPRMAPAKVETVPQKIVKAAQPQLGTTETGGDNCQKYSGQCVSWCALFAMNMWQDAGVDVNPEEFAFTGNVYETGQEKGTAYDADNLKQAKPGDVLLFGTSPSSPSTSKHIGVVEKVDGDQVTTIEGNSGDNTDSVVRKTHELSSETFYGGVHPW